MTIQTEAAIKVGLDLYRYKKQMFDAIGLNADLIEQLMSISLLSVWDIYYLWEYAKKLPDESNYLELGAYCGGSLVLISEAAKQANKHFNLSTIDITVWTLFLKNCKDIKHTFHHCSADAAKDRIQDNSIDLLFIDGDHTYPQVKMDFINYFRKLKIGGLLLGHDYPKIDVAQAATEVFGADVILPPYSCMFAVKKERELE